MANTVNIVVRETGTRTVVRNLNTLVDAGNRATRSLRLLQNALFVLGGAGLLRSLQQNVDSLTNFENRIRLVTDSTEELNDVQAELFRVAEQTRSAFDTTAEVYTRTALSVRELGISQQQTIRFTESLNQAVILSGASVREANAALIQLGQGLASNRLSGDELRSVLEQLPFVADVIARSLGVTRGELRELGRQGKITGQVVLDAFAEAREEIAGKFANTVSTISQAFTVLETNFLRILDQVDDATGASAAFADAVIFVAQNLDTVGKALLVFGAALSGLAIGLAIQRFLLLGAAIRAVGLALALVNAAFVATPLGALLAIISALVTAMFLFGEEIKVTADGFVSLSDAIRGGFIVAMERIGPVIEFIIGAFTIMRGAVLNIWEEIEESVTNFRTHILNVFKAIGNSLIALTIGLVNGVIASWDLLPAAIADIGVLAFNGLVTIVEKAVNAIIEAIKDLFSAIDDLAEAANLGRIFGNALDGVKVDLGEFKGTVSGAAREVGQTFQEEFRKVAGGEDFIGDFIKESIERGRRFGVTTTEVDLSRTGGTGGTGSGAGGTGGAGLDKIIRRLEDENKLLQVNFLEREKLRAVLQAESQLKRQLTQDEAALVTGLVEANSKLRDQSRIFEEIRGPADEFARSQAALIQLLADGRITLDEFNQKLLEVQLTFLKSQEDGASKFGATLLELSKDAADVGEQISQALTNSFTKIEDVFVEFVRTGKINFQQLTDSIISDFTRILVRALILRPILQGLTAGLGVGNLPGFANGGSVIVGGSGGPDSQLFAARVSPGERIDFTPRGQQGGGGGSGVQVNIINNAGVDVNRRSRRGSNGQEVIDLALNAVDQGFAEGRFDGAVQGRFGLGVRQTRR